MLRELQLNKKQSLGVVSVKNQARGGKRTAYDIMNRYDAIYYNAK